MGHQARRRFGQNFLHDRQIIERIVASIQPAAGDHILEIGPGQGALTMLLCQSQARVTAVEIDRDLAAQLARNPALDGLNLINQDIMQYDLESLIEPGVRMRVIGNLPYNISTPVLFRMLRYPWLHDMHFMLQKEVVDRICAEPGSKTYGRLSVMVQVQCEAERLFTVGPGAFRPAPKVDSAVFRLSPRPFATPCDDLAHLDRLVRQSFSQRRKTLNRSLKGLVAAPDFDALDIDPGRRPETLSVGEFVRLANRTAPVADAPS